MEPGSDPTQDQDNNSKPAKHLFSRRLIIKSLIYVCPLWILIIVREFYDILALMLVILFAPGYLAVEILSPSEEFLYSLPAWLKPVLNLLFWYVVVLASLLIHSRFSSKSR